MAFNDKVDQMFLQQLRVVRRAGIAATDLPGGAAFNIFNIAGGLASCILVRQIWGVVTTVIGAGAAVPRIQFTPTGLAQVPLCAAAASIATDAVGTVYTYPLGTIAAVLAPSPAIGMADTAATGWTGDYTVLTGGIIAITNAVASTGVIDWYIAYIPCTQAAVVTPL